MVDTQVPVSLAKLQTRLAWSPPKDETRDEKANQPEQNLAGGIESTYELEWAGSRDKNLLDLQSREKLFS